MPLEEPLKDSRPVWVVLSLFSCFTQARARLQPSAYDRALKKEPRFRVVSCIGTRNFIGVLCCVVPFLLFNGFSGLLKGFHNARFQDRWGIGNSSSGLDFDFAWASG